MEPPAFYHYTLEYMPSFVSQLSFLNCSAQGRLTAYSITRQELLLERFVSATSHSGNCGQDESAFVCALEQHSLPIIYYSIDTNVASRSIERIRGNIFRQKASEGNCHAFVINALLSCRYQILASVIFQVPCGRERSHHITSQQLITTQVHMHW